MFSNTVFNNGPEAKQSSGEESSEGPQLLDVSEYSVETSYIEDNKPREFKNQVFDPRTPSPNASRRGDETPTKQNSNNKSKNHFETQALKANHDNQREIRATFMKRGDDAEEEEDVRVIQRKPSERSVGRSDNEVKSHLLDDSSDDYSRSCDNSVNLTQEKIKTQQNPFGFQITAPTDAEDRNLQGQFRPTANFDAHDEKISRQNHSEHQEKFSLMAPIKKPPEEMYNPFTGAGTSNPFANTSNPGVETSNPFASNSNPFGITSNEEDEARPSGNFGFFQGHKSPVGTDKQHKQGLDKLIEEESSNQILEEEEESKLDKSDISLVLNRDALDKWRYKMDRRRNYPAEEVEAELIEMDHALSMLTDASQDFSQIGIPTFKNKFYDKDKDSSFYLNMTKLQDNSMISQIGDSSMIKDKKNKSILDDEIKLIDLTSELEPDTSYSKSKSKKGIVKPLSIDLAQSAKSDKLNDSNVVTKAERIKDEARKQANMNESYVFSKIDRLFDEVKDFSELNESKRELLEDMDRSRNRLFSDRFPGGETDRFPGGETDRTERQKELEFFDRLLDISQIQSHSDIDHETTARKAQEKMFFNEVFNGGGEHSHSSDDGSGEKHNLSKNEAPKKTRLRNPDLLNVSTNEGAAKKQKGPNKLDTTAPLDQSVDIEELKKGVPSYNLAFGKEVHQEKPIGRGDRKNRPRNPNAGNVSFTEKTDKEGNKKLDTTAPLYSEGNVDKEDLRKGIQIAKPSTQKILQEEDAVDNSQRKSKLRNPDALNVSTFEVHVLQTEVKKINMALHSRLMGWIREFILKT